jgi:hypothetical protein
MRYFLGIYMSMSSAHGQFATALNCMDGRAVGAVLNYFQNEHDITYVDTITDAGMDGICSRPTAEQMNALKKRVVEISVQHHGSRIVAVVGHADCAGNPVDEEKHKEDIKRGVGLVSYWDYGVDEAVHVLGLWVAEVDGQWKVAELVDEKILSPQQSTSEPAQS